MPSGYLTLVAIIALYTAGVLWPPRRPKALARAVFILSHPINELPFVGLAALLAGTVVALIGGDLASTAGVVLLAAAAVTALGLLEVARQGWLAGPVVQRSLHRDLGSEWHSVNRVATRSRSRHLIRAVLAPLPVRPRNVQRIRDVAYGQAGRSQRLDVYRRRGPTSGEAPVLIHFHGGHFRIGAKSREALPLLHRLAGEGWVCISANYRLGSAGRFPNSLIDAKAVIAWVRSHAARYGADPSVIIVAGSSAGAHLASMAALTANEPAFQPDGEHADTSVAGAVCLYGYYGDRAADRGMASSPAAYVGRNAPPFLIAHGDHDTQIAIGHADRFVARLRTGSISPVVYLRLPGAQHLFDLFRSLRFDQVVDGIETFATWVRVHHQVTATRSVPGGDRFAARTDD